MGIRRFRKRPVVVEAFRLGHDPLPDMDWWGARMPTNMVYFPGVGGKIQSLTIPTLEGDHRASYGDWVVKGVMGETYPVRHDIFLKTYESVDE